MTSSAVRWAALNLRFAAHPGLRRRILSRGRHCADPVQLLRAFADNQDPQWDGEARKEIDRASSTGITILTIEDAGFPPLLRASCDPPPILYIRGRLLPQDVLAVAVVGSRRATPHGLAVARRIAEGLAGNGFAVVSGLARGIDAAGHAGALAARGRTLAVLGSGLHRVYPAEHRALAKAIAAQGAVISEVPLESPPLKRNFPERNRLIAWLSWATVVVEAARDSGSLITAHLAADEGRAVYCVPGPVGETNAEGTNALLREGAMVCRGADDIIEDLAPQVVDAARVAGQRSAHENVIAGPASEASRGGRTVLDAARTVPVSGSLTEGQRLVLQVVPATRGIQIDRLGEACDLDPGALLATLLELELMGLVRQLPGRRFTRSGCTI